MRKIRKTVTKKTTLETRIVEDSKVLSTYGYCEIPAHFFDRALAQMSGDKKSVLSLEPWKGRNSSGRSAGS